MHSAPSVTCPVGRSRFAGRLALLLWLLGAGLAAHACATAAQFGWRQALVVAVLVASGALAARVWATTPIGMLRWDGQNWLWIGADAAQQEVGLPGSVSVMLDLQQRVLVRWSGEQRALWLWLERGGSAGHWHEVRCAIHARPVRSRVLPHAPGS